MFGPARDVVELGVVAERKGQHLLKDEQLRHHLSPVFELDDVIEQKIEVREPSQPHVVLDTAQMLQVLIIRLLPRLDSAPNSSICPDIAGSPITVGVTPQIQGPSVGFQTHGFTSVPSLALPRFAAPLVSSSVVMYVAELKSFERFVRLAPSKFDDTVE
ncbi:hypothetical protein H5410_062081 [Solanum commersonii]|uniref:Uncharacterized protein n=1 Tax=Solanum commersonii TaxID=4109 RepID=A0A9J5W9F5_SOLCO|nr:hypothetical protein H5410_062081 [Solanum commersonii]